MTTCKIIEDSTWNGVRITTFQLRLPRIILAELNTHGILAKSSRSTRAVPTAKLRREVLDDPFVPSRWYKNGKGMAGKDLMVGWERGLAALLWCLGRYPAVLTSALLSRLGVHKQHAGRPLEPWMWVDTVVTGTEWSNFFNLRISASAQPEFDLLARAMKFELEAALPIERPHHLPYITEAERQARANNAEYLEKLLLASARRCASVSYAPHDGSKASVERDAAAAEANLLRPGHMSPFDHPAVANGSAAGGRFSGLWRAYRKTLPYESDPMSDPKRKDVKTV